MPRSLAREQDILKLAPPKHPPRLTSRRIGIHTSSAGGPENAAERAWRLGCNTFQIFSSSPRQWRPYTLSLPQCVAMNNLRARYGLKPLVIHTNYLINLAGGNSEFHARSMEAFRGELERALALCAEYLVLHPGSHRGLTRQEGLRRLADAIRQTCDGLPLQGLTLLIENTPGAEFSLGGSFEQVGEVIGAVGDTLPAAACIDTCHTHVGGYDIVSEDGMQATLLHLDRTVGLKNVAVWHCNDAKTQRGSRLDRHQHIGQGTIGLEPFRRLLNDPRTAHSAFIAETPIDHPGDDMRNVARLKSLVVDEEKSPARRRTRGSA